MSLRRQTKPAKPVRDANTKGADMKRFTFAWTINGVVQTACERFASFKAAERRANELAREFGVDVRTFWQGWTAKGQLPLAEIRNAAMRT
jgi:hypothetical protein